MHFGLTIFNKYNSIVQNASEFHDNFNHFSVIKDYNVFKFLMYPSKKLCETE